MKKGLNDLVGVTIEHKVFGSCQIIQVDDVEQGKFTGKIVKDNTTKKLIFSNQFFKGIECYATVKVECRKPIDRTRKCKEVDLSKYRNHPLVKEIDRRENGYRKVNLKSSIETDDDDNDDSDG